MCRVRLTHAIGAALAAKRLRDEVETAAGLVPAPEDSPIPRSIVTAAVAGAVVLLAGGWRDWRSALTTTAAAWGAVAVLDELQHAAVAAGVVNRMRSAALVHAAGVEAGRLR